MTVITGQTIHTILKEPPLPPKFNLVRAASPNHMLDSVNLRNNCIY